MERRINMVKNDNFIWKKAREGRLKTACKEYIEFLEETANSEDRIGVFEARIFEAGLQYICGENIFEYVRKLEMKAR